MVPKQKGVVLITGASSGIGHACAQHLHQIGYRVFGTSRHPEDAPSAAFEMIQMDVDSVDSVSRGVAHVMEQASRLDVVVNNAGIGFAGSIEDTTIAEAKAQFETNFFGALRLCQVALPIMRQQRAGTIVNISSLAGQIGIPFQGFYSASKFALEGMSETLRMEVKSFNIHVVLIEPGDFHTEFTDKRRWVEAARQNGAYQEACTASVAVMETDERQGPEPIMIAHKLEKVLQTSSPHLRYPVGPSARTVIMLKRLLPGRLWEWIIIKKYKLI